MGRALSMLAKEKMQRPTMRQAAAELDRLAASLSAGYGAIPLGPGSLPGAGLVTPVPGSVTGPGSIPGTASAPSHPGVGGPGSAPGTSSRPGYGSQGGLQSLPGAGSHPGMGSLPGAQPGAPPSTLGLSAGQVPAAPGRRLPLAAVIGGTVGAIAVAVALFVSVKAPPPIKLPPPAPRPVAQPPPPPPEPAKPMVHWAVTTEPEGAMVVRQRDGQALGLTPLSLTQPAGSGTEQVRLVLQGYAEAPLSLDLAHDANETVELHRKSGRDKHSKGTAAKPKGNNKGYVPSDLTVVD